MKILVIDRDALPAQTIKSKLETRGHKISSEMVKNDALKRLETESFDAIYFDPAPLNNARPLVLGMRRSVKNYPYIALMSSDTTLADALKAGANNVLRKPLDLKALQDVADDTERLAKLMRRLGDDTEDFPSAGGVISKSAFNQLFLSAVDRAYRYGERSFLVFIGISNYQDIVSSHGAYAATYAAAKLSQYLVRLRRQSDIIAQTGKAEYCLLLQRPNFETEPLEATSRFAGAIESLDDICSNEDDVVEITVTLTDVPVGALHASHTIMCKKKQEGRKSGSTANP